MIKCENIKNSLNINDFLLLTIEYKFCAFVVVLLKYLLQL